MENRFEFQRDRGLPEEFTPSQQLLKCLNITYSGRVLSKREIILQQGKTHFLTPENKKSSHRHRK